MGLCYVLSNVLFAGLLLCPLYMVTLHDLYSIKGCRAVSYCRSHVCLALSAPAPLPGRRLSARQELESVRQQSRRDQEELRELRKGLRAPASSTIMTLTGHQRVSTAPRRLAALGRHGRPYTQSRPDSRGAGAVGICQFALTS